MSTPHNRANNTDFAKTVLMPGDPLRAKVVAETYLDNPKLVTDIRNIYGYTGTYKGEPISVMASGMGMPSISIYATELYDQYNVENIIRIGTAGAYDKSLNIGDIVIGSGASTDSNIIENQYKLDGHLSLIPKWDLLSKAVKLAEKQNVVFKVGNILSGDVFYNIDIDGWKKWEKMGIIAVEMEAAAIYALAAQRNKGALGIMTISDSIPNKVEASAETREKAFTNMMEIALNTAIEL